MSSRPQGSKRKITYNDFTVRQHDPEIIQQALTRPDLNIEQELLGMDQRVFEMFRVTVLKNKSMERIIDYCLSGDLLMKGVEVWKRANSHIR